MTTVHPTTTSYTTTEPTPRLARRHSVSPYIPLRIRVLTPTYSNSTTSSVYYISLLHLIIKRKRRQYVFQQFPNDKKVHQDTRPKRHAETESGPRVYRVKVSSNPVENTTERVDNRQSWEHKKPCVRFVAATREQSHRKDDSLVDRVP